MRLNQRVMDPEGDAGAAAAAAAAPAAGADAAAAAAAAAANPAAAAADPAKAAADAAAAKAAEAAAAVPETYTFAKVKVTTQNAQGQPVETEADVEAELVAEVSEFAKANKLTQAQAQAYMDRELKLAKEVEAEQATMIKSIKDKWNAETKADKVFAGEDGTQFDANMAIAKRALEAFFPGVSKEANQHPFLDHPEVLKGLLAIGKQINPDGKFVQGGGNNGPVNPAKIMFPSMN